MLTRISLFILLAVAGATVAAGTAVAGSPASDSQVTISPRAVVAAAGQPSPVDVGGVPVVRAGKRIPARYVLIGRHVKFVRGTEAGFGALTMRCPAGKSLRGLARQGGVGLQVYRNVDYVGKRSVDLIVDFDANRTGVGATVEGTILATRPSARGAIAARSSRAASACWADAA